MVVFLMYFRFLYFPRVRFFSTNDLSRFSSKGDGRRNIKCTRCNALWPGGGGGGGGGTWVFRGRIRSLSKLKNTPKALISGQKSTLILIKR